MPGTAAGTVSRKQRIVASAIASGVAFPPSNFLPGYHHVRLEQEALVRTPLPEQLVEDRVQRTGRHFEAAFERVAPSISTSGSTIGTIPSSWHSAA